MRTYYHRLRHVALTLSITITTSIITTTISLFWLAVAVAMLTLAMTGIPTLISTLANWLRAYGIRRLAWGRSPQWISEELPNGTVEQGADSLSESRDVGFDETEEDYTQEGDRESVIAFAELPDWARPDVPIEKPAAATWAVRSDEGDFDYRGCAAHLVAFAERNIR